MEDFVCINGDVEGFADSERFSVETCFPSINDEKDAANPPLVVAGVMTVFF